MPALLPLLTDSVVHRLAALGGDVTLEVVKALQSGLDPRWVLGDAALAQLCPETSGSASRPASLTLSLRDTFPGELLALAKHIAAEMPYVTAWQTVLGTHRIMRVVHDHELLTREPMFCRLCGSVDVPHVLVASVEGRHHGIDDRWMAAVSSTPQLCNRVQVQYLLSALLTRSGRPTS